MNTERPTEGRKAPVRTEAEKRTRKPRMSELELAIEEARTGKIIYWDDTEELRKAIRG